MKIFNIVGLTFFLGGLLSIFVWLLYDLVLSVDIPPAIKWGLISIIIGVIVILISLIKERSKENKEKDL
jgi:tetrahydromethanopterin S-methyltransferase subunit E